MHDNKLKRFRNACKYKKLWVKSIKFHSMHESTQFIQFQKIHAIHTGFQIKKIKSR